MAEGFIQVTEPIFFKKDKHIKISSDCKKIICVIKGKFILSDNSKILESGEVFGLDSLLSDKLDSCDLIALEDSTIIEINNKNIEKIMKNQPEAFRAILSDAVILLYDIGRRLC